MDWSLFELGYGLLRLIAQVNLGLFAALMAACIARALRGQESRFQPGGIVFAVVGLAAVLVQKIKDTPPKLFWGKAANVGLAVWAGMIAAALLRLSVEYVGCVALFMTLLGILWAQVKSSEPADPGHSPEVN